MGQTRHLERKREARQKGELEKLRESIQEDRKRGSANLFSFPSSCFVSLPGHPSPVPGLSSTTVSSFPRDRLWQVRRALTVGIYRCYDARSINGFFPRRLEGCFSGAFCVPLLGEGHHACSYWLFHDAIAMLYRHRWSSFTKPRADILSLTSEPPLAVELTRQHCTGVIETFYACLPLL